MRSRKQKIIVIVGPTASGKSELAVQLAKKFNGEIISADSRQVYRGLDIGTGKVPGKWRRTNYTDSQRPLKIGIFVYKGVPHHCIDFISPKKQFSAEEFKDCAKKAIRETVARGKTPIIAGGTGFWIDTLVYDLGFPDVPPNLAFRKKLAQKSAAELLQILQKLDPKRAKTIEQKNPRRLIRAIEIAKTLGKVPNLEKKSPYETLWIGISVPKETLKKKIQERLRERLAHGMVAEAYYLHRNLPWKRFYELGLEYRFLADLLRKRRTKTGMQKELTRAIGDYARRQMVWFKRNKEIHWIKNKKEAEKLLKPFLKNPSVR